jgi:hypothetical protein
MRVEDLGEGHDTAPTPVVGTRSVLAVAVGAALVLLLLGLAGDRATTARAAARLDLPPLVLRAWDRNDELSFLDTRDTAVAFLAATLTLRGAGVVLTPRHNPLVLPEGVSRVAVAHVESDRAEPPVLNGEQLRRFVELLAAVSDEVPHRVLQVDYEAVASQRSFFIEAIAALRQRLPDAAISVTAPPPGASTKAGSAGSRLTKTYRNAATAGARKVEAALLLLKVPAARLYPDYGLGFTYRRDQIGLYGRAGGRVTTKASVTLTTTAIPFSASIAPCRCRSSLRCSSRKRTRRAPRRTRCV